MAQTEPVEQALYQKVSVGRLDPTNALPAFQNDRADLAPLLVVTPASVLVDRMASSRS